MRSTHDDYGQRATGTIRQTTAGWRDLSALWPIDRYGKHARMRSLLRRRARAKAAALGARPESARKNGVAGPPAGVQVSGDGPDVEHASAARGSSKRGSHKSSAGLRRGQHAADGDERESSEGQPLRPAHEANPGIADKSSAKVPFAHEPTERERELLASIDSYDGATIMNEFGEEELISALLRRWRWAVD